MQRPAENALESGREGNGLDVVGQAMGWKAGSCLHVQISDLFSMGKCDKAMLDFLATTEVGKFPPGRVEE
jgi:hypothetical protein